MNKHDDIPYTTETIAIIDLANGDKKLAKHIDNRLHQRLKGTEYNGYAFFDPRGDIIPSIIRDFNEIRIFKLKIITIILGLLTLIFFGYFSITLINKVNTFVSSSDFESLAFMCVFGMILCVLTLSSLNVYEHFKRKL